MIKVKLKSRDPGSRGSRHLHTTVTVTPDGPDHPLVCLIYRPRLAPYQSMATRSPSAGPSTTQGVNLSYDPEQDPEERRRVRRNYRDLAKETESRTASWTKGGLLLIDSQM